ncbi:hypothetical protein [Burkholderia sp. Bp9099]|uniref:hypothetical protein n=1 Tax=Burkholderia sp. Bp9099 TaxID=2184568 RepID=UPI000F5F3E72|nr:hypothetical protein [Burkholderia sp. Bp9099]
MKNWKTVLSILIGIVAVILVSVSGATSVGTRPYDPSLMASWMQAIGSVAAIIGAYWVAERQGRAGRLLAMEMDKIAQRRQYEAYRAIVENGSKRACDLKELAVGAKADVFAIYWQNTERVYGDAISALTEIPLHSLGSYKAVNAVVGMKDALIALREVVRGFVEPLMSPNPQLDEAEFRSAVQWLANNVDYYRSLFGVAVDPDQNYVGESERAHFN